MAILLAGSRCHKDTNRDYYNRDLYLCQTGYDHHPSALCAVHHPPLCGDHIALLAKNPDREPNEAHRVMLLPAVEHAPGRRRCTYIEIDQAPLHANQIALDFFDQDR